MGGVEDELAQVWWMLGLLDRFLGNIDEAIINFSMNKARDYAWSVAERLAPLNEVEQARKIEQLDSETLKLARFVRYPGIIGGIVSKTIRVGERGAIPQIIEILS